MTFAVRWKQPDGTWGQVHLVDKDHKSTRCGLPLPSTQAEPPEYEVGSQIPESAYDIASCARCHRYLS